MQLKINLKQAELNVIGAHQQAVAAEKEADEAKSAVRNHKGLKKGLSFNLSLITAPLFSPKIAAFPGAFGIKRADSAMRLSLS